VDDVRILLFGDASSANVQSWVGGLQVAGADLHVASFSDAPSAFPVHRLMPADPARRRLGYLAATPQARRITQRLRPDLVIGYYVTGHGLLARKSGCDLVVQVAVGNDVLVNPPRRPLHAITRRNLRAADLVITWAPHLASAVRSFGVAGDRVVVQARGIDLSDFPPRPQGVQPNRRELISTRSLDPYYRPDVLIDALAELQDTDVSLTLLGGGPHRPALEDRARRAGVAGQIRFLPRVPTGQLGGVLAEHGTYVSACPTDGVSASLLEAMAVGLYPVVIDHPANRDWIVSGETGQLTECSSACLASALRTTLAEPWDRRPIEVNRDLVRDRADLSKTSAIFVEMFETLVARPGAQSVR
jgi:glycosyltransferase involved in cell wall biosynthesis